MIGVGEKDFAVHIGRTCALRIARSPDSSFYLWFDQASPGEFRNMTRWIIIIVIVIVLTAVATFFTQNVSNSEVGPTPIAVNESKGPQPKVEIAGPLVYDFGKMSQMRTDTHTWEVKNVGDADLELWMHESTCSCTIAKLSGATAMGAEKPKVRVKPKQTTPIDLQWETKTFEHEYVKGATIGTNDPSRPYFTLNVKGVVFPPVTIYPPEMITLNGISNEENTYATVAVFSMDMPAMKLTRLSTGRPAIFTTNQTPLTKKDRDQLKVPGGGYRVDLVVKPGLPLGQFSDTLVIETDHPLRKEVKISINGYATGPISIVPNQVRMTGVNGQRGGTHSLSMLVRGGKEVNFKVVKKSEKIDVTIAPYDAPNQKGRYRLTVAVPPGSSPALIQDDIVIETDHPKAAEIKIPVRITITNSASA
jgi:hypothetical protein